MTRAASVAAALVGALALAIYFSDGAAHFLSWDQAAEDPPSEQTLREIQRIRVRGYINAVAWSPDGSRVAALSNFGQNVALFDTKTWKKINEFRRYSAGYSANSLAFLNDNTLLTSTPAGLNNPSIDPRYSRLDIFSLIDWNPETGQVLRYFPDSLADPANPAFPLPGLRRSDTFSVSLDGKLIAAINNAAIPSSVLLYDAKSGSLIHTLVLPTPQSRRTFGTSLAFSPQGDELAVGTISGSVQYFDLSRGVPTHTFSIYRGTEYYCAAMAHSPDGKLLAVSKAKNINLSHDTPNSVDIFDAQTGTPLYFLSGLLVREGSIHEVTPARTISWSPSRSMIAVGDGLSLRVWLTAGSEPKLVLSREMAGGTYSAAFSFDGRLAASDNDQVVIYR